MAAGWYHQGTPGLLAAVVLGAAAGEAAAAPAGEPPPLLDQWVDLTDRPPIGDVALTTEERRIDADGRRWVKVLVEDPAVLGRRGLRVLPATPPAPMPEGYTDPATGTARLAALVAEAPRAGLVRLGRSVRGQPIDAAWFGQEPSTGAPAARLLADHHGDEAPAWELALAVAEALAAGDGADEALTEALDRSTIWVVPYVNPDGAADGTRTNANGVDLNRNYGLGWSADEFRAGAAPFSEPETRAVRAFGALVRPVASVSLHSGATNLGWPWNWTEVPPVDAPLFEAIGAEYVTTCAQPGFWLTQGGAWFLTRGDTNDWAYGRYGVLDLTLELTEPKTPPASEARAIVDAHLPAVLELLATPPDVSGRVVDAETGRPIEARITVEGSADTFGDPLTGRFHRRMPPGVGELVVSAPGFLEARTTGGEVALERAAWGEGRPEPAVVLANAEVALPGGAGGSVRLVRAGEDDVALTSEGGRVVLPALAPGAWTLIGEDGRAWREALIVADALPPARLDGDQLRVAVRDAGPGPRAFAYAGEERRLVELDAAPLADAVEVDLGPVRGEEPLDLVVVADGGILAVPHPFDPPVVPRSGRDEELVAVGGAACDTFPGHRSAWLVSMGMCTALAARARRRR